MQWADITTWSESCFQENVRKTGETFRPGEGRNECMDVRRLNLCRPDITPLGGTARHMLHALFTPESELGAGLIL